MILVIFILVLGVPSFIALCPQLYYFEAKKTNAESFLDNPNYFYKNVHEFLVWQKPLAKNFTNDELSHMNDVRFLFNTLRFLSIFSVLFIISYFLFLRKKYKEKIKENDLIKLLLKSIKIGCVISLVILGLLIIITSLNFNNSFNVFHKIFFPHGNWIFSVDSLLIILFPESFFLAMAKKIIIITIFINIVLLVSLYFKDKIKDKKILGKN